jgi:hypothetical protein
MARGHPHPHHAGRLSEPQALVFDKAMLIARERFAVCRDEG